MTNMEHDVTLLRTHAKNKQLDIITDGKLHFFNAVFHAVISISSYNNSKYFQLNCAGPPLASPTPPAGRPDVALQRRHAVAKLHG